MEGSGWVRADLLQPGAMIRTAAGCALVDVVSFSSERQTVYNLTVSEHPNYFVGPKAVWVHNCGNLVWTQYRADHVRLHNVNNLKKAKHGVFYDDGVHVAEEAWTKAQQSMLTPAPTGELDVPMGRAIGWEGGAQGTRQSLSTVRIVINPQTLEVITAYPIRP